MNELKLTINNLIKIKVSKLKLLHEKFIKDSDIPDTTKFTRLRNGGDNCCTIGDLLGLYSRLLIIAEDEIMIEIPESIYLLLINN